MLVQDFVLQLRAQPTEAGGEALKELPLSMKGLTSLVPISSVHSILQTNLFVPNLTLDVVSTSDVPKEEGEGFGASTDERSCISIARKLLRSSSNGIISARRDSMSTPPRHTRCLAGGDQVEAAKHPRAMTCYLMPLIVITH